MVASNLRLVKSSGSVTRYRLLRTNGAPAKPFGLCGERPTSLAVPDYSCGAYQCFHCDGL